MVDRRSYGAARRCRVRAANVPRRARERRTRQLLPDAYGFRAVHVPLELASRYHAWLGENLLHDVPEFRSGDEARILADAYRLSAQHFEISRQLLRKHDYDFFMLVDIGVDRLHHALWRHMDPDHPRHEPGSPFASAIHDYYVTIDNEIGSLLQLIDDDTIVLVVSDHGAKPILGGLCINEWLIDEGYLTLKAEPPSVTPLTPELIDWGRTRAWSEGGYYARIFLNVRGREPYGVVEPDAYTRERDELAEALESLSGPDGEPIGTTAHRPEQIYAALNGVPPDLLVYFGDLNWRSIGSVGHGTRWTQGNDTGPDEANHSEQGLFVIYDPRAAETAGMRLDLTIYDVAPTILSWFDLPPPRLGRGQSLSAIVDRRR